MEPEAASVTTLEYRELRSEHPRVTALTPDAMRDLVLRPGALEPFDALGSVSSVEHSGLGRYGDALNPWGDLMAVARAWCIAKPGAQFLLGVPYEDGADRHCETSVNPVPLLDVPAGHGSQEREVALT